MAATLELENETVEATESTVEKVGHIAHTKTG